MTNSREPSLHIWQVSLGTFVLGSVLGTENMIESEQAQSRFSGNYNPLATQTNAGQYQVTTQKHIQALTLISDIKGHYQVLRERISRKLFKPGGCERLFEEVRFELRSEVKELILGEGGKGGEESRQRLWSRRGGSCRFEDVKDSQGHCSSVAVATVCRVLNGLVHIGKQWIEGK